MNILKTHGLLVLQRIMTMLLMVLAISSATLAASESRALAKEIDDVPFYGPGQPSWAQYSPFVPTEKYKPVPPECTVTQLERHGARYPTDGATARILAALKKVQAVKKWRDSPELQFIAAWEYELGVADLVRFGALQSFESGQTQFRRYPHLVSKDNLPFVRASDSARVVESANNWTSGFAAASQNRFHPKLSVIISEDSNSNNTLDDNLCINAGDSSPQQSLWNSVFAPPIRARLNKAANRDLNLTNDDVPELISLCAFDSVARENLLSEWCGVWEEDEMDSFDYWGDLDKYYGTGYGQPLGPVQGVGYINELIARLTNTPVIDSTQTNTTLTSSPLTFPLGRSVYADFSHDNQMIAIYAAMGLFDVPVPLDPSSKEGNVGWKTRKMTPFSGRMVVERMECRFRDRDEKDGAAITPGVAQSDEAKQYVRVLVGDKVMRLEFCDGVRKDGICELGNFVVSQGYARRGGDGDWEKCLE